MDTGTGVFFVTVIVVVPWDTEERPEKINGDCVCNVCWTLTLMSSGASVAALRHTRRVTSSRHFYIFLKYHRLGKPT